MLDFCDQPYSFFEAKPNRLVMAISRTINRLYSLGSPNHRVRDLQLTGEVERLRELAVPSRGARLLFVANHSTHSDPQVMTEVQRQVRAKTHFMAAYDVFLRSKMTGWFLQHNGEPGRGAWLNHVSNDGSMAYAGFFGRPCRAVPWHLPVYRC